MKAAFVWFVVPVVLVMTWLSVIPRAAAPAGTIAYVSAQRIAAETPEGRANLARVQALQRERTADVRAKQEAFAAAAKELEAAQPDNRARLQTALQQRRTEFEQAVGRAQADVQALQRQVNADLLARVRGVVLEVVKGRDIQVVLNLDTAIVWAAPSLDLTDPVIARMNATPAAPSPPK